MGEAITVTRAIPRQARIVAGSIALVGIVALVMRFCVSYTEAGSVSGAVWGMLRFFTIIGNLVTTLILLAVATGGTRAFHPARLGGITLTMLLIGIVYTLLLRGLHPLVGWAKLSDVLLHYIMPPLVVLYWLLCAPKGQLKWRYPARWTALPLAYFGYALIRASFDGRYPYPFMDVSKLGWPQTLLNALVIALGFLAVGYALVGLDRRLASIKA